MPEISVIIPVYRVERTLRRCVDSVLRQTFSDYEIILIDDGSPDNSGDICDAYAAKDDRISVIHRENGGLSAARNTGLPVARGRYIMFLDSDDHLTKDCLEELSGHDADMIIGSIYNAHEDGRKNAQSEHTDEIILKHEYREKLPALLEERRLNYVHAKLYRTQIIREHALSFEDDMLTSAEDTVFNFTFLRYCQSIYICAKPVHYYMQDPSGLGKRFYPDRYERYRRLNRFIETTCIELGIDSRAMHKEIYRRIVLSAYWSVIGIIYNRNLTRTEKLLLLERIRSDEELNDVFTSVDAGDVEDLRILLYDGSRVLLSKHSSFLNRIRRSIVSVTSPRLRNRLKRLRRR